MENKELEALETIKNELSNVNRQHATEIMTIRNGLNQKQKLEQENAKYKKAIDIFVRTKLYSPNEIMRIVNSFEDYDTYMLYIHKKKILVYYTEEEFNLLKEVFGNE